MADAALCLTSAPDSWFEAPLTATSHTVQYAPTEDAVDGLDPFAAVLVDGGTVDDAVELIERITVDVPGLPVIFLADDPDRVEDAFAAGATECATPAAPGALRHRLDRLVDPGPSPTPDAEQPLADAALFESILSDLFAGSDELLYFKDAESRFVRVSESMARLHDTTRDRMRGMTDFDVLAEDDARQRYENEQRIMRTGAVVEDPDERLTWADGEMRWFHSKKMPLTDADGERVGTFGVSRDVTELRELEETLAELESLIDDVPVALLAVDASDEITWANDTAARTLTPVDGDPVGHALPALSDGGPLGDAFMDRYGSAFESLLAVPSRTETVIDDVTIRPSEDERRVYDVHVKLLPLANESFRGTVLAFHDVTTQAEQERMLERQYEQLERLVETITHDLRNPLLVASGKLEVATERHDSDAIADAEAALERMERLVDDLLTMAQVGQTVDGPEPLSLTAVAERAWRPFEDSAATLEIDGDRTVEADEKRLVRLFENLFRNAREHGPVEVGLRVGTTAQGFFVADDGPGIDRELADRVFEHGFTTSEEGTGLGLAIVAEIVSAHGWSIEVSESDAGGARFDVRTGS